MALWETQEGSDICIIRGETLFFSLGVLYMQLNMPVTVGSRPLVSVIRGRDYINKVSPLQCIQVTGFPVRF